MHSLAGFGLTPSRHSACSKDSRTTFSLDVPRLFRILFSGPFDPCKHSNNNGALFTVHSINEFKITYKAAIVFLRISKPHHRAKSLVLTMGFAISFCFDPLFLHDKELGNLREANYNPLSLGESLAAEDVREKTNGKNFKKCNPR